MHSPFKQETYAFELFGFFFEPFRTDTVLSDYNRRHKVQSVPIIAARSGGYNPMLRSTSLAHVATVTVTESRATQLVAKNTWMVMDISHGQVSVYVHLINSGYVRSFK
jgi:hypothetical protein